MLIKNPKDFWAGAIYLGMGVATVVIARDYPMGTAIKMGPAYFPTILGALLSLFGLAALLRSFRINGAAVGPFAWKGLLFITAAVLLFGVLARGAGLIPALVVLVVVSAYASAQFHWGAALALAAGLTAFCSLVFVKVLGIPLPLLGPWLGI
jgi:putative tricarboxylic transport membrane protein